MSSIICETNMFSSSDLGQAPQDKPRKTKSRTGCLTCKKKRLKCDETKPECNQCTKRKQACGGYATAFKWKSFEEQHNTRMDRQKVRSNSMRASASLPISSGNADQLPGNLQKALEVATMSLTGRSSEEVATANALIANGENPALSRSASETNFRPRPFSRDKNSRDLGDVFEKQESVALTGGVTPSADFSMSPGTSLYTLPSPFNRGQDSRRNSTNSIGTEFFRMDNSPRFRFASDAQSPTDREAFSPSGLSLLSGIAGFEPEMRITSHRSPEYLSERSMSNQPSPSSISESIVVAHERMPPQLELNDEFMKILGAFDRYTCGIMSIKNGPTENPWRSVILPSAVQFPILKNALGAMTCFHVARGSEELRSRGIRYMKSAIIELVNGLSGETLPPDVALTVCLCLAVSESWDRHTSTGIAHLKGAKTMITKIIKELNLQRNSLLQLDSNTQVLSMSSAPKALRFMYNQWVYFDVLARMTSDDADEDDDGEGEDADDECALVFEEEDHKAKKKGGNLMDYFEVFNNVEGDIDPLLGCCQALFPIMGKVANLAAKSRKSTKNSLSLVSKAAELKSALEKWKPMSGIRISDIEDPSLDLSSCIATAEAYRYATLIYLHQAVPELPSKSCHDLSENVLMLIASIPSSSRTCITHIFPLLVASCEALPGDERVWVKARWELMSQRMWIGNIDRALEVVKETWARNDILKNREKDMGTPNETSSHIAARISQSIAQARGDEGCEDCCGNQRLKKWAHWTTVMKDWGWEVFLG